MAFRISLRKIGQLFTSELRCIENSRSIYILGRVNPLSDRFLHAGLGIRAKSSAEIGAKITNKITDEKLVYVAQNDPDIFGKTPIESADRPEDPGDIEEENYIRNPPRRSQKLAPYDYARIIKDHLDNKRIKEAIDVLEIRMLKEDRVKPTKYIYNLLISGCAKAGYTKHAFQLYNKMKQRGLPVTEGMYTSLFNACANAPWAQDGLNKANRLREIMLEKGYVPNSKNYNAMIKAYGRCRDIQTAFQLADEMKEKGLTITAETFNFLLQACASDPEFGFRHALITWHKMLKRNIIPDIYSFNIMLRCVRDCSFGDVETMEEVISKILNESPDNVKHLSSENKLLLTTPTLNKSQQESNLTENTMDQKNTPNKILQGNLGSTNNEVSMVSYPVIPDAAPNLLSSTPHLGSLVSIGEIKEPSDKLLLLGGFSGFLNEMKKAKVTPGIETFTALLEVIPSTRTAEKQLISMIRKIGLKADIDFFNILIKKRCMRFDYEGGREVCSMIKTAKLHPDIVTYAVLSLGCQTQEDARELMHEMRTKGIRMNNHILGAMLRQGCANKNFAYIHEIMQICLEEKIKPNEIFLKHLDNFYKSSMKLIENKHPTTKTKTFRHNFKNFENKLKIWYEEYGIENLKLEDAVKKLREHPYQQFKDSQNEGLEETKNDKLKRKQKIRKHIKRIKIGDLKDDTEVGKVNTS